MIKRTEADGSLLVITQPAHAWLAGEIGERWGNDGFPVPEPREELLLAAHLHDAGWAEWEANPRLQENGTPPAFYEITVDEQLANWRRGIRTVSTYHPYAGTIVALHAAALMGGRLRAANDPVEAQRRIEMFLGECDRLVAQVNDELSGDPRYAERLPANALPEGFTHLRLHQVWDWLSLILCGGLTEARQIDNVPGGDGAVTIGVSPLGSDRFAVRPWPFDCERFTLRATARHLRKSRFVDEEEFWSALANARREALEFEFVKPG